MSCNKFSYLAFFLVLSYILEGQIRFNRIYPSTETYPELLVLDSGYVTMVQDYYNKDKLIIREYDVHGNIIDSVSYLFNDSPETTGRSFFQLKSGSYINCFVFRRASILIKFNRQWDTISTFLYQIEDTLETDIFAIQPDSDTTFIITGSVARRTTNKVDLTYARMDTNFNLLWERSFKDSVTNIVGGYYGNFILPLSDGYLISGVCFYNGGQLPNRGIILRTNTAGDIIWKHEITSTEGTGSPYIGFRSDGNYFFISPQNVIDTNLYRPAQLRFGIIDKAGNLLEDKLLGSAMSLTGSTGFTLTPDGNFAISGYALGDEGIIAYLSKFNEDGDNLWQRFHWHGYPSGDSWLTTIHATPDSGFIGVGEFSDYEKRYTSQYNYNVENFTWLLKLDQYGCDTANCEQINLPKNFLKTPIIDIYPNPFSSQLNLKWTEKQYNIKLKIYNSTGQLIYKTILTDVQQSFVDTKLWPSGIYYLFVKNNEQQAIKIVKE